MISYDNCAISYENCTIIKNKKTSRVGGIYFFRKAGLRQYNFFFFCLSRGCSIVYAPAYNRPYAYDVTEGRPRVLGVKRGMSRAPSSSMQPASQPLHAIPPGRSGPTHWLRGSERQRSSSTTRARSATSLDPQHGVVVMEMWRQCIRSIDNPLLLW